MTKDICELCHLVYSSTSECHGFYVSENEIEQLETQLQSNPEEHESHLYGWFDKNCRPMYLCRECRKIGMEDRPRELLKGNEP